MGEPTYFASTYVKPCLDSALVRPTPNHKAAGYLFNCSAFRCARYKNASHQIDECVAHGRVNYHEVGTTILESKDAPRDKRPQLASAYVNIHARPPLARPGVL